MVPVDDFEGALDSKASPTSHEEAPLTALEKLGSILLMIRDHDTMSGDAGEESTTQERPPRAVVLAAFDKLWKEAEAEATDIALEGLIATLQRALKRRGRPKLSEFSEFLTVDDAAQYLGVSRATVYAAVNTGQLPHVRFAGRQIRIPRSHFEQAVAGGHEDAVAEAVGAKP